MANKIEAREIIGRIPQDRPCSVQVIGGESDQDVEETILRYSPYARLTAVVPLGRVLDERILTLEEFNAYTIEEKNPDSFSEAVFNRDGFDIRVDQRTGVVELKS